MDDACVACDQADEFKRGKTCVSSAECTIFGDYTTAAGNCITTAECNSLATPSAEYYTFDTDHTCIDATACDGVCFIQGDACIACD